MIITCQNWTKIKTTICCKVHGRKREAKCCIANVAHIQPKEVLTFADTSFPNMDPKQSTQPRKVGLTCGHKCFFIKDLRCHLTESHGYVFRLTTKEFPTIEGNIHYSGIIFYLIIIYTQIFLHKCSSAEGQPGNHSR